MSNKAFAVVNPDPYNEYFESKTYATWVCSLCYPFALEIGHLAGCGSLIYMENHPYKGSFAMENYGRGKYALLHGQGHRDDESIIFDEKPRLGKGDDDYSWYPYNMKFDLGAAATINDMLVKYAKYSYKKHGCIDEFLIKQIDGLIKRFEKKYGQVEVYYKSFVGEREICLNERAAKRKEQEKATV